MLEDKDLLSIQEVRTKVEKAFAAWQKYRTYSQEQVDAIVERMAAAARANAKRLADLAVEETGYGNGKNKKIQKHMKCESWAGGRPFCPPPIPPPRPCRRPWSPSRPATPSSSARTPARSSALARRPPSSTRRRSKPARPKTSFNAWTAPPWKASAP